jgi:opacity protein-like surface antigen
VPSFKEWQVGTHGNPFKRLKDHMNRVTSVLLASTALSASMASGALAGPPTFNWSGFYIGANVGVVGARSNVADGPLTAPTLLLSGMSYNANGTSVLGGVQAGYNWQTSNFVYGLEGDISFGSKTQSTSGVLIFGATTNSFNARFSSLATIRGRLGWASDQFLFYGTGGIAFANLKDELVGTSIVAPAASSSNATGWVAGAGVEYALAGHWTAKAEYLHVGFANRTGTYTTGISYSLAFKDSLDIGRIGINYKF